MKGLTLMVNSVYNGSRFEDLWLDNSPQCVGADLFTADTRAFEKLRHKVEQIRAELVKAGILKTARLVGTGVSAFGLSHLTGSR